MITVYHNSFEIEVTPFINLMGNTSYLLNVFDYRNGGAFAYSFIRYTWHGGTRYFIIADSDGYVSPHAVSIKRYLEGFNWSLVKREIRFQIHFRTAWS